MVNHAIIEKIQKLLSLANSDNEHEAKIATQRANELLLKYNLSMQSIEDHQSEYEISELADVGLSLKRHQTLILSLMMEYFFVKAIISKKHTGFSSGQWGRQKAQYQKVIQLVGTKENSKIAGYIFSYLNDVYPKLWKDLYDRDAKLTQKDKISYYRGLTVGIGKMLNDTKWKVQEETGLVLVEDPDLKEFVKKHSTGSYGAPAKSDINPEVYKVGVEHGKNVTLRKPIESKVSQDNTKRLTNSK